MDRGKEREAGETDVGVLGGGWIRMRGGRERGVRCVFVRVSLYVCMRGSVSRHILCMNLSPQESEQTSAHRMICYDNIYNNRVKFLNIQRKFTRLRCISSHPRSLRARTFTCRQVPRDDNL